MQKRDTTERIPLKDIKTFSKCPAYLKFSKDTVPVPTLQSVAILTSVIQKCYIRHTETGFRSPWKTVSGWVDQEVFKEVDTSKKESYDAARKLAERLLLALRKWYYKSYKYENSPGYVNINFEKNIGKAVVYGSAPIITVGEIPTLIYFGELVPTVKEMYNDIEIRGLGWLAAKQLDVPIIKVQYLGIGPRGFLEDQSLTLDMEMNNRAEEKILQMIYCMQMGLDYPSFSPMCNTCPFKPICHL